MARHPLTNEYTQKFIINVYKEINNGRLSQNLNFDPNLRGWNFMKIMMIWTIKNNVQKTMSKK